MRIGIGRFRRLGCSGPCTERYGRRRGWLLFSQLLLIATILLLATADPARSPAFVALAALLVATASSTQDFVFSSKPALRVMRATCSPPRSASNFDLSRKWYLCSVRSGRASTR